MVHLDRHPGGSRRTSDDTGDLDGLRLEGVRLGDGPGNLFLDEGLEVGEGRGKVWLVEDRMLLLDEFGREIGASISVTCGIVQWGPVPAWMPAAGGAVLYSLRAARQGLLAEVARDGSRARRRTRRT